MPKVKKKFSAPLRRKNRSKKLKSPGIQFQTFARRHEALKKFVYANTARMVIFFTNHKAAGVFFQQKPARRKKVGRFCGCLGVGLIFVLYSVQPLLDQLIINDLLGGRGWWLVKGVLNKDPFLFCFFHIPITVKAATCACAASWLYLNFKRKLFQNAILYAAYLRRMVIAVNTRFLKDAPEGSSMFIHEVFSRITAQHPAHQFYFLFDRPVDPGFVFSPNVTPLVIGPPASHPFLWKWWYDVKVPRVLKKIGADVFVSPDGCCSLTTRVPQCLVVHDLNFLNHPPDYKWSQGFFYRHYTPTFLKKAKQVVTTSRFVKQALLSTYKIEDAKVVVVYNGVDDAFQPLSFEQQTAIKETYTDGQEYFIYVGAIHQRKNLINLLKAFSRFKKRQKSSMKQVLLGHLAWKSNAFSDLLKTYKYRSDVVLLDAIESKGERAHLIAAAYALVYPAVFDDAGAALVEAMRCGVPVLTANHPLMQEITGGHALYFDAEIVEDMAEQLMRIYKDETTREHLVAAAKAVAQHYTWDEAATALWQCIENAVKR